MSYEEFGPTGGHPLILLHGWPDSPRTWDKIRQGLCEDGFHCFAPYLRGFGQTCFLSSNEIRSGQSTALASDLIEFSNALGLESFSVAGHDWGAFASYLAAANWPDRIQRLVALSVPYGINNPSITPGLEQARAFWYQWLFQTEQGQQTLAQDPSAFCRFIWDAWMTTQQIDERDFEEASSAWQNPDWIAITLHYYRNRWGTAKDDPAYDDLEGIRLNPPPICAPTLLIHGSDDPCILAGTTDNRDRFFSGDYRRELLPGVGHFPQRESPETVCALMTSFLNPEG
nr:alpha/beta hydrolase [Marinobacter sp.]